MKFLIIIPAHNEEKYILDCLKSLESQTFQNFKCIIVNDYSTDKTKEIVTEFIGYQNNKKQWKLINHCEKQSFHEPGAKVVNSFNIGLNSESTENYGVICKFDADIVFPKYYLEEINDVYEKKNTIGMVSGLVYIKKNNQWVFENLSSKNHIRGPIKSYRKECFLAMNGLKPVLGWDNIDVMLCKMYGYETFTIKNLWVKHLRPTAEKYKNDKAKKLGEYFYNIGLSLPLAIISSLKSSIKNKSFKEFFITIPHFLKQNNKRLLTKQEIAYIRKLRWKESLNKIFSYGE